MARGAGGNGVRDRAAGAARGSAPAASGADFLWAVYVAESDGQRITVPDDDYEEEAGFVPVAEALELIDLPSRIYVEAVLGLH